MDKLMDYLLLLTYYDIDINLPSPSLLPPLSPHLPHLPSELLIKIHIFPQPLQPIAPLNNLPNIRLKLQILQLFQHLNKLTLHNQLLPINQYRNRHIIHILYPIRPTKYRFPQPYHIKHLKLLSIQQRHPAETVVEWIYFEFI